MTPLRVRLRELREAAGLSQGALAALANVRQATISTIETGKVRRFDADVMERLAKALGVPPHTLFVTNPAKRAK
jgi:transcriptional regulator with XRE-family HTH domain